MISEVVAVNVDWFVGPLACQSQLPPSANIFLGTARNIGAPGCAIVTTVSLSAKDSVQLLDCKFRNWIVLVDEDTQGVIPSRHIKTARDHGDLGWITTEDALEHQGFIEGNVATWGDVSHADTQRGN